MYAQFADYLAQVFCLERLRHLVDPKTGWDGPKFFGEKALLFECVTEAYWAQRLMDWNGRKQYELLNLPRGEDGLDNERVKEAEALVQGVLSMSSTLKLSHGLVTAGREYLADIWDNPEKHASSTVASSSSSGTVGSRKENDPASEFVRKGIGKVSIIHQIFAG
jgi:hypothetical protein